MLGYGIDLDFDRDLDDLRVSILDFDLSYFTRKGILSPKTQHILASALFIKTVKDMDVKFHITIRKNAVFSYSQGAHAQNFILVVSINELDQHMSHVGYRNILRYRLMISLFPIDEVFLEKE